MVSDNENGCDGLDMGERGDGVTRLTGRRDIQGNRLHWAVLGFTRLFWTQWTVQCTGLF